MLAVKQVHYLMPLKVKGLNQEFARLIQLSLAFGAIQP